MTVRNTAARAWRRINRLPIAATIQPVEPIPAAPATPEPEPFVPPTLLPQRTPGGRFNPDRFDLGAELQHLGYLMGGNVSPHGDYTRDLLHAYRLRLRDLEIAEAVVEMLQRSQTVTFYADGHSTNGHDTLAEFGGYIDHELEQDAGTKQLDRCVVLLAAALPHIDEGLALHRWILAAVGTAAMPAETGDHQ